MLPTYEQCLEKVEASEAFYVKEEVIGGYKVATFNYRLATYNDFLENDAFELRGLTFIDNNGEWEVHPMLHKFFNVNENEGYQYGVLKNKDIEHVEFKEDGSLITFVRFPDGKIVSKTKMSFDNEQTRLADGYLAQNPVLAEGVRELSTDYSLLFELVSPLNKIVLRYDTTELKLLKVRDKKTGAYLTNQEVLEIAERLGVKTPEVFRHTLEELFELRETEEIEGWVIKFTDGMFAKLKTEWYITKHRLREQAEQEHELVNMVLNEEIDDLLAELDGEEKEHVLSIVEKVDKIYNHVVSEVERELENYKTYPDRKAYAVEHNKDPYFGLVMRALRNDVQVVVKDWIKKETNKLEKAREFLGVK